MESTFSYFKGIIGMLIPAIFKVNFNIAYNKPIHVYIHE